MACFKVLPQYLKEGEKESHGKLWCDTFRIRSWTTNHDTALNNKRNKRQ
jgi:hypothetical protein